MNSLGYGYAMGHFSTDGTPDYMTALEWYLKAAELGVPGSIYNVGNNYAKGTVTADGQPDYATAIEWFDKAVELDFLLAAERLADLYIYDNVADDGTMLLAKDYAKAFPVMEKADELGTQKPHLLGWLGWFYAGSAPEVMEADYPKAAEYYTRGAELGDGYCMYMLGMLYLEGRVGENDFAAAAEWLGKAAETGRLDAAERLAKLYIDGCTAKDGTELFARDYAKALPALEKAYELDTKDTYILGWLGWFHEGNAPEVMEADYPKAAEYYTRGAELGDGFCMYMLGMLYLEGRVGENDYAAAAEWLGKAAETGRLDAAEKLSELYTVGRKAEDGTMLFEVDYAKALPVLEKAYELNTEYTHVHNFLGWIYAGNASEVMAADYGKALEVYTRGAELGSGYCMEQIGLLYRDGKLGEPDTAKAIEWFEAALAAGHEAAQLRLDETAAE